MARTHKITKHTFEPCCPLNWKEIADYLNELLEHFAEEDDWDEVCALYEDYCNGNLECAPKPIFEEE